MGRRLGTWMNNETAIQLEVVCRLPSTEPFFPPGAEIEKPSRKLPEAEVCQVPP